MANWTCNVIHVAKNIEEFKNTLLNEKGEVDFIKIVPMPLDLNIERSSDSYEVWNNCHEGVLYNGVRPVAFRSNAILLQRIQKTLDLMYSDDISQDEFVKKVLEETVDNPYFEREGIEGLFKRDEKGTIDLKAMGYYNYRKYGFTDWYTFRLAKWGTKWNAGDTIISENSTDGLFIEFNTANGNPYVIMDKLAKSFDFSYCWAEECKEDFGIYEAKNGELNLICSDEDYEEAETYYIASKIHGYDTECAIEEMEENDLELSTERMEELDEEIKQYLM